MSSLEVLNSALLHRLFFYRDDQKLKIVTIDEDTCAFHTQSTCLCEFYLYISFNTADQRFSFLRIWMFIVQGIFFDGRAMATLLNGGHIMELYPTPKRKTASWRGRTKWSITT